MLFLRVFAARCNAVEPRLFAHPTSAPLSIRRIAKSTLSVYAVSYYIWAKYYLEGVMPFTELDEENL